jgi:glycerate kinase
VRVVLAPDKFKGSLPATDVVEAMRAGVLEKLPRAQIAMSPLADGGEGTQAVLLSSLGGATERVATRDALGRPTHADLALLADGSIFVESASASGLAPIAERDRDPLLASTHGTGDLIAAATKRAPTRIVVGVGGTATTDGGTGAATALGWRFLDASGDELTRGGGDIHRLARIQPPSQRNSISVVAACDVDVSFCGPRGAAAIFSPQKGAGPEATSLLDRGLRRLEERIHSDLGIDLASRPYVGAGGGLAGGLLAFLGAELVSGFDLVADAIGLAARIAGADLVITGEGRLDEQSFAGKTVSGVARLARTAGVPCIALAGEVTLERDRVAEMGLAAAADLVSLFGRERPLADPAGCIAAGASSIVASILG